MRRYPRPYQFRRHPRALRKAKLDNLAMVPASLLPFKEQWQEVANSKAAEEVLIVLPTLEQRSRRLVEQVATQLREKGHAVTMLAAEQFQEEDSCD